MIRKAIMLVVDDMETNRAALKEIFGYEFTVLEAANGEQAMSILTDGTNKIDIILLDLYMPVMDGFVVLQELKKNKQLAKIPAVVTTKYGEEDNQIQALSFRAADFISKPYNPEIIRHRVKNIMTQTVLERQRLEQTLDDTAKRLKSLIDSVPGGIGVYEVGDTVKTLFSNNMIGEFTGYSQEEYEKLTARDTLSLVNKEDRFELKSAMQKAIRENEPLRISFRINHKDGQCRWVNLSAVIFEQKDGHPVFHAVFMDITDSKRREEQLRQVVCDLEYRVKCDNLTGIYNRETFYRATSKMLLANKQEKYVMLRFDISNFKIINELFGTDAGDAILKETAVNIRNYTEGKGTFGRLSADDFAICIPKSQLNIDKVLEMVTESNMGTVLNYNYLVYMGIFEIDEKNTPVDQMCDRANMALNTIKGSYIEHYAYYNDSLREQMLLEHEIINEMNDALKQGQFCIYLQPIFSAASGLPCSAEVLVRWKHPKKGLISPGLFIPIFERNGFVTKLDAYVCEVACKYLSSCIKEGKPVIPVSVNISRLNLYNPNLCNFMIELVKKYNIAPSLLKFEITESAYTDNPDQLLATMRVLQDYGFKILMDDFGSGYSSLNMLKDVPVDILKIDMRFIDDIDTSERATNITTSIIRMAKWLDMDVIVEGVETKQQLDYLCSIGCDLIQGYYYSRPIPTDEFDILLAKQIVKKEKPAKAEIPKKFDFEELLRISKECKPLLGDMIDATGVYELVGENLELLRVSEGYYELFGGSPQTMLKNAKNIIEYVCKEDREVFLKACHRAVETLQVQQYFVHRKKEDGTIKLVRGKAKYLGNMGKDSAILFIVYNDNFVPGQFTF